MKKQEKQSVKLCLLGILLAGSPLVSGLPAPQDDAIVTTKSDTMARVYVYRYKAYEGKALRPSIYVDDQDAARLQSGRGVVLALPPGKHVFRSNDKQSQIQLDLKAGESYYMRMDLASGFWKGHGRLMLMQPEQGAAEYRQVKPIDHGMIKAPTLIDSGFTPTP